METLSEIITAFEELGGKTTLSELYDYLIKNKVIANNENDKAKVRACILHHSSDSLVFDGNNIFKLNGEKGEGFWSLVSSSYNADAIAEFLDKYEYYVLSKGKELQNFIDKQAELLSEFKQQFPISKLPEIEIDDYVVGKGQKSFCWWIETGLVEHGHIKPAFLTSFQKFGIDYDKKTNSYRIGGKKVKGTRFGSSVEEIFNNIKKAVIDLVDSASKKNIKGIAENKLNELFKNKITYCYFENDYLPIYGDADLNTLLTIFEIPFSITESRALKREKLFGFYKALNRPDMSTFEFMRFVYDNLGYRPLLRKDEQTEEVKTENYKLVDVSETSEIVRKHSSSNRTGLIEEKPETLRAKKLSGKRGEFIVQEYLENHRKEMNIKEIEFACNENDHKHYDISYRTNDGKIVYIEVKATKSNSPSAVNFEMSEYEYDFMNAHRDNYFVYYINDVYSGDIILRIPAKKIILKPSKFRANFNFQ